MYRVTLVNTLDNMSFTQLMAIDVVVTAIKVRDPIQGLPEFSHWKGLSRVDVRKRWH